MPSDRPALAAGRFRFRGGHARRASDYAQKGIRVECQALGSTAAQPRVLGLAPTHTGTLNA